MGLETTLGTPRSSLGASGELSAPSLAFRSHEDSKGVPDLARSGVASLSGIERT